MGRIKKYAVWIVVAAAIAWQYRAPILGRVWWFEDIQAYFHPLWTAASKAMSHGVLPSWDLGAWSGQPLTGDPQIGIFYPPNWIWTVLTPMRAYAWSVLAHAGIAAAGMASLAHARGRSHAASALAALSLALSAFMVLELRHIMFVQATAWLPWLLWGLERYSQDRRLDRLATAAGALGLAILSGGWSMLWWGLAVAAVYSAGRAFAIAVAVGVAVGAVQVVPAMMHARWSPRALGLDYSEATSYAWPSFRYLITLWFPTWYGTGDHYSGAPDQWELCGYAVGAVTTVLAVLSLVSRERRGQRLALFALMIFGVILARGDGTPIHKLLFDHLPIYGSMRCPARSLYICTIVLPILGADGLDWILSRARRKELWGALAVVLLAAELCWTWRGENPSVTLAETRALPAAVGWLKLNGRPGRMVNDVHLGQRWHNLGLLVSFESAGGYNSLPVWRYLHYLWIANHGAPYPHAQVASDLTAQGLWKFSSPLVDLLSVKWLMASRAHPPEGTGWVRMFEGADQIDVWRNDEALPRGFMVYRTRVIPDEAGQARAIAEPSFHPDREVIVDRELGVGGGDDAPTPIFGLYRSSSLDLAVEVVARKPGVLVLSEVWYPGWKVLVDEKPAELLRVDYALRGVFLPKGKHIVAMAIEDDGVAWGAAISLTALVLLLGLSWRERRKMLASR